MSEFSRELIARSGYEREGFPAHYDRFRPRPPRALLETLLRLAGVERAALVVDLGAGTGLSTRAWAELAARVVGVEPNPSMLARALEATEAPNVEYRAAFAHETGLPDGCADLVTCSQSLHWMEPGPTFAEAARILRPGGAFAAYDYDVPPRCDPEVEAAFQAYLDRRHAARGARGIRRGAESWPKTGHLERLRASGRFSRCRELVVESVEEGGADALVGLALSMGLPVPDGDDPELERELAVEELAETARRVFCDRTVPFRFRYRIRAGVRYAREM